MPEINVFRVVQLILASLEGFPYLVLVKNPDQNEVLVLQIYFVKPILFIQPLVVSLVYSSTSKYLGLMLAIL
jgi:hypothetical protein